MFKIDYNKGDKMNTIEIYQNALKEIVDELTLNKEVISIFVFGSMVTGDLWEGSDIDLLVVCNRKSKDIRDIYTEVQEVPIHVKMINFETFEDTYMDKRNVNMLLSSKLIYSNSRLIDKIYDEIKYLINFEKSVWNLVYFSKTLKLSRVCKKYIHTGGVVTSYEVLIRLLGEFSKLILNIQGYVVSKDSISMACNLDDKFNYIVKELLSNEVTINNIEDTIDYIEKYLKDNVNIITNELLNYLRSCNEYNSAFDLSKSDKFNKYNIKFEYILNYLYEMNVLERQLRTVFDLNGVKITNEKVYKIK